MRKKLGVRIARDTAPGVVPFKRVFEGFEVLVPVRGTFGKKTREVLEDLKVEVVETRGYLHIDDERGLIVVNSKYLREGPEVFLYLDVVHELVHIRQLHEGKELFDRAFSYVDRPTEVEAYRATVAEARRIGLADKEIADYLRVEWVSEEDFKRFLDNMGVSH